MPLISSASRHSVRWTPLHLMLHLIISTCFPWSSLAFNFLSPTTDRQFGVRFRHKGHVGVVRDSWDPTTIWWRHKRSPHQRFNELPNYISNIPFKDLSHLSGPEKGVDKPSQYPKSQSFPSGLNDITSLRIAPPADLEVWESVFKDPRRIEKWSASMAEKAVLKHRQKAMIRNALRARSKQAREESLRREQQILLQAGAPFSGVAPPLVNRLTGKPGRMSLVRREKSSKPRRAKMLMAAERLGTPAIFGAMTPLHDGRPDEVSFVPQSSSRQESVHHSAYAVSSHNFHEAPTVSQAQGLPLMTPDEQRQISGQRFLSLPVLTIAPKDLQEIRELPDTMPVSNDLSQGGVEWFPLAKEKSQPANTEAGFGFDDTAGTFHDDPVLPIGLHSGHQGFTSEGSWSSPSGAFHVGTVGGFHSFSSPSDGGSLSPESQDSQFQFSSSGFADRTVEPTDMEIWADGDFISDTNDCASIASKTCSSSAECSCNGFYTCLSNRCQLKTSWTTAGSEPSPQTVGGQWHDQPIDFDLEKRQQQHPQSHSSAHQSHSPAH